MAPLIWVGIVACMSQSAILSGLNIAVFSVSRLELQIEVAKENRYAQRVQRLRRDSNFLLVTILWGNVAVNVLLALLSGSVLAGLAAFLFSTVVITIFGEILPQAYFTRHALRIVSTLYPLIRVYQAVLFIVAKPTAMILDVWLGPEGIRFLKEKDIRELIRLHMQSSRTEIERFEGQGALNFLALDDVPLSDEGELLDPESIVELEFDGGRPVFPPIRPTPDDEFLIALHKPRRKWIVIVDSSRTARVVVNADEFIGDALFADERFDPHSYCHRPIIVTVDNRRLGEVIPSLIVEKSRRSDDVIDNDVILLWGEQKRIITGADVLGRLLRGIVRESPETQR